mgnify:CR=1 FL=1
MSLPSSQGLVALAAVADHTDLPAAASALGLREGQVHEDILALEDALGARLVNASGRTLTLTSAGQRLLPQARRTVGELRRCQQLLAGGAPQTFDLTIGTRFELGLSWLVPSLDSLRAARPERNIHVVFGSSDELLGRMDRGEIDALISSTRHERSDLGAEPLHSESYVFVGSPQLLQEKPLRGAEDAPAHVLVDTNGRLPLFRYLLEALESDEVWPFGRVERMGTIAAIRHRVLSGAGVAVLPRYFVQADLDQGRMRMLMSWLQLREDSFRLLWRAGHLHGAELRQLARELRAVELR